MTLPEKLSIAGGCLCSAVRYLSTAAPLLTRVCWCRDCQYFGAGSGTVNTWFPAAAVEVSGPLTDYASVADSGRSMHRRFCPRCGTHVLTQSDQRTDLLGVRSGTLDDPELARPAVTVWTAHAPSWATIDQRLPRIPGQPDPAML